MNPVDRFASRLRELRRAAGLSQAALAQRIGVSSNQISHLERDAREPTWPMAVHLAEALGVTVLAFLALPAAVYEPRRGHPQAGK